MSVKLFRQSISRVTTQKFARCNSTYTPATAQSTPTSLYTFTSDELALRDHVNKFTAEHMPSQLVADMDHNSQLDADLLNKLFDSGLMGIEISDKYNGSGMSFFSSIIAIEELAKVDAAVSVIVDVHNTLINTSIIKYGTQYIKDKWLPSLSSDTLGSFCLSESGSGSDAFALKCSAVKQGNKYILNGSKLWITNAQQSGLFIVFANVNPSAGYKGITAFCVARDTPGMKIGKHENKLGIRASSTCEVILDNVEVDEKDVLGEVGQGYKIAIGSLNEGRIGLYNPTTIHIYYTYILTFNTIIYISGIGAQMLGLAQGCFDATIPYLFQRKQFGAYIGNYQAMQQQYAQLACDIECSRLLVYNAARMQQNNQQFIMQAAMAKLHASQTAQKVASTCIDLVGGVGFTKDFPQEKYYRDSKIGSIYEGTSVLQLQTIAKLLTKDKQTLTH